MREIIEIQMAVCKSASNLPVFEALFHHTLLTIYTCDTCLTNVDFGDIPVLCRDVLDMVFNDSVSLEKFALNSKQVGP